MQRNSIIRSLRYYKQKEIRDNGTHSKGHCKIIINLFYMITKVKGKYEHDEKGKNRYGKDKNGTSKVEK